MVIEALSRKFSTLQETCLAMTLWQVSVESIPASLVSSLEQAVTFILEMLSVSTYSRFHLVLHTNNGSPSRVWSISRYSTDAINSPEGWTCLVVKRLFEVVYCQGKKL